MALTLSADERRAMLDRGLVLFGDRLIRNARPPVDEKTLAKIAARCSGPLPEGLVALWRTSFGGTLDYELDGDFGGVVASISFRELFFPGSNHYRDIDMSGRFCELKVDTGWKEDRLDALLDPDQFRCMELPLH